MQQIGDWLKKLGMSEYAPRFVENRIDLSVLPDLTDQDLEKLGVLLGESPQDAARDPQSRQRLGCRYGTRRDRGARANSARRRRAPPADGDVHRPRWVDRALDQARPRGHARGD